MARELLIRFWPDNKSTKADISTGEVSNIEILDFLQGMQEHFAQALCAEFKELTGKNANKVPPSEFEEWVKFLRENKL